MLLPDVNVWLAFLLSKHPHHLVARNWFEGANEPASVFFCRATQQALLRLLTTAAVFTPYGNTPLTNREAWEMYAQLAKDDRIAFTQESPEVEATWKILAMVKTPSPKLWMDAYLAAFAISGKMRLVTLDRDFRNFEQKGLSMELLTS